jgi:ferredoxin
MAKRQVIRIDEERCTGCGECIPGCPEGALQIIEGKCRLVSDLFCDGLGACIRECPEDAISIEEREAGAYSEIKVLENVVPHGPAVIKAHLLHLAHHGQQEYLLQALSYLEKYHIENPMEKEREETNHHHGLEGSCPGTRMRDMRNRQETASLQAEPQAGAHSCLTHWPVQLALVNAQAPYFKNSHLLVAADCVPFACPDFHPMLLKGKSLAVFCPKLDHTIEEYGEKLTALFQSADIQSVTVVHMEVPCCSGVGRVVVQALERSGKSIPVEDITVSIEGRILAPA